MFCYGNGSQNSICEICALKSSKEEGGKLNKWPNIDIYKDSLTISFGNKVIAKDFAVYFGCLQERIVSLDHEKEINIDFTNTNYINHFCISKILLTVFKVRKEKIISFLFPYDFKNNKMLRFLYNRGILDFIFSDDYFQCYVGGEKLKHYSEVHSFCECYDNAIFPYTIFETKIEKEHTEEIERIINWVLSSIKVFFNEKNQSEKYKRIQSRIRLYLYEIVDNVFEHAYTENAVFAINVYNSYLPPYKVLVGTPEEYKFENRIIRLQKEVPMSVYKDIHDRYFGGINIFVDDIGAGIAQTYKEGNGENKYKDVYINGSRKRKTINGLKLVADQIAINADSLWAHDHRNWISTSFTENNNICKDDKSQTLHYVHPVIKGVTYDIFVNLAQNSKEKKKTYEQFGEKISFKIEVIQNIISEMHKETNKDNIFVDLLNYRNKNRRYEYEVRKSAKYIFFRPRATQKNKMANELENRILIHFNEKSQFEFMVVYDLNQTTLFQMKAVFENRDIGEKLIQKGIKTILLFTEESWLFKMIARDDNSFVMYKHEKEVSNQSEEIVKMYKLIFKNDKDAVLEFLNQEYKKYIYWGKTYWGYNEINEYVDIEKMIVDRAISDLLGKSIARISGMLSQNQKLIFLEKFMEMKFGALVNEYKSVATENIYFGSIIMSGDTERRVAGDEDIKIYLFKHNECSIDIDEKHLIMFELPIIHSNNGKSSIVRRRVLNTNRVEECSVKSEEYKYYQTSDYLDNIGDIEYKVGFFETGFLTIKVDDNLYSKYTNFILDLVRIKLRKFDFISIQIMNNLRESKVEGMLKIGLQKIRNDNEFRNFKKEICFGKIDEASTQLIIKVGKNLELMDLLTDVNHSKTEIVYIPVFNNILFDSNYPKILGAGYIPYLPLYYTDVDPIINTVQLEKFEGFKRNLNPRYRKYLFLSSADDREFKMNIDLTNEIMNFYSHTIDTTMKRNSILSQVIRRNVGICSQKYENLAEGLYNVFIEALLLQHSLVRLNISERTKIINNILNFLERYKDEIEDSVITYFLLIVVKNISYDSNKIGKLFDKEVGIKILKSKSKQVRILFADIYNENCRLKFETELDDFYVKSDIAIYYNMLAQLSFNSHGTIHDSVLDRISKKIIECPDKMNQKDFDEIYNVIPNCIALLKLTRSYDKSMETEESLEKQFAEYAKDIPQNMNHIRSLIEDLTKKAEERFVSIDKINVEEGIVDYVKKVQDILVRKQYKIDNGDISNVNFIMGDDIDVNDEGHIKRNINLYNDTIIFEEIAYLLHNAHQHSYTRFSRRGNADKKYLVWIRVELHGNVITVRLFNSIEKKRNNFADILNRIHAKKRIGKTYLEKFNIHVLYYCNPKGIEVESEDIDIFETRIEIPYFN